MRRLLTILLIGLSCTYAHASCNTVVQHKTSAACTTTSCAVTVTSTGSGHILVYGYVGNLTATATISSVSGGGTWTHCSNCSAKDSNGDQVDISYTLASTGGVTTITATLSSAPALGGGTVWELSCTGVAALDTSGSNVHNTACTTCAGEPLTLSGASDAIVQITAPAGTATAVTSPYNSNQDFPQSGDFGDAGAVSQSSGSAPNWTTSSGVNAFAAIAFNDVVHANMPPVVY
jgi:hypothetical protein